MFAGLQNGLRWLIFSICFALQVAVFVKAWTSNGKSVVENLRQRTLAPNQVSRFICLSKHMK